VCLWEETFLLCPDGRVRRHAAPPHLLFGSVCCRMWTETVYRGGYTSGTNAQKGGDMFFCYLSRRNEGAPPVILERSSFFFLYSVRGVIRKRKGEGEGGAYISLSLLSFCNSDRCAGEQCCKASI
jgi:hypothetical protein